MSAYFGIFKRKLARSKFWLVGVMPSLPSSVIVIGATIADNVTATTAVGLGEITGPVNESKEGGEVLSFNNEQNAEEENGIAARRASSGWWARSPPHCFRRRHRRHQRRHRRHRSNDDGGGSGDDGGGLLVQLGFQGVEG